MAIDETRNNAKKGMETRDRASSEVRALTYLRDGDRDRVNLGLPLRAYRSHYTWLSTPYLDDRELGHHSKSDIEKIRRERDAYACHIRSILSYSGN